MQAEYIVLAILFVWLLAISFVVLVIYRFFHRLTKGIDNKDNLIKVLDKVISEEKKNSDSIGELKELISLYKKEARVHIQKIGLVRFNPFQELGGDHSFSLALLDADDTGIIITGLHTRDRTRVYIKDIKKGKSAVEISKDEEKALKKARDGVIR
jgi:hypothetical protein